MSVIAAAGCEHYETEVRATTAIAATSNGKHEKKHQQEIHENGNRYDSMHEK